VSLGTESATAKKKYKILLLVDNFLAHPVLENF
jgi:hypothetical protein